MNDDQARADTGQAAQQLPPVRQISVVELRELMESETAYELVDVRTDAERAIATVEGFRLLDQSCHDHLVQCDPETRIIFQCHHGIRSQQVAEYFRQQGFRNLSNVNTMQGLTSCLRLLCVAVLSICI
jgi:monothiol glutaredoxin